MEIIKKTNLKFFKNIGNQQFLNTKQKIVIKTKQSEF